MPFTLDSASWDSETFTFHILQATRVLDSERLLPVFILRKRFQQFEVIEKKKKQWWNIFSGLSDVVSSRGIISEGKGGNEDVSYTKIC